MFSSQNKFTLDLTKIRQQSNLAAAENTIREINSSSERITPVRQRIKLIDAYKKAGLSLFELGCYTESLREYLRALFEQNKLFADGYIPPEEHYIAIAKFYYDIAIIKDKLHATKEAKHFIEKAINQMSSPEIKYNDAYHKELSLYWQFLGDILKKQKRKTEAKAMYNKAADEMKCFANDSEVTFWRQAKSANIIGKSHKSDEKCRTSLASAESTISTIEIKA